MANWRDRITVAPLWAYFLMMCALCGPAFGVLWWLLTPEPDVSAALAGGVLFGLCFPAVVTFAAAKERRRLDEAAGTALRRRDRLELARAARVGEPPADPALDRPMLALLERRLAQTKSAARTNPWIFGALALFSLLRASDDGNPQAYAGTAVFLVFLIASPKILNRKAARLQRLEQHIRTRSEKTAQPKG
jgi:hypothetical protein